MSDAPLNQQPMYIMSQTSPETEGAATTALWLEIIFGFFGFLGVGHTYGGRTLLGISLMGAWWVYIVIESFAATFTVGLSLCLTIPLHIAVPIISGIQARTQIKKVNGTGNWPPVGMVVGGGCLSLILIGGVILGITLLLGLLVSSSNTHSMLLPRLLAA